MDISIVIPVFNEEAFLESSIESLLCQTHSFRELILVDDGSTDQTVEIAQKIAAKHPFIQFLQAKETTDHEPGKKVVAAFNRGFAALSRPWDVICKFDADIIFPEHYLENLALAFRQNPNLGMYGGLLTIYKNNNWELESVASTTHIRGPIKAYSKKCFAAIDGLHSILGWDTLDELLALYFGFVVQTNRDLRVKHLRPTGSGYSSTPAKEKGALFYGVGYGLILGLLASFKWAMVQRGPIFAVLYGFLSAWITQKPLLVSKKQARFIRKYRWSAIANRFFS